MPRHRTAPAAVAPVAPVVFAPAFALGLACHVALAPCSLRAQGLGDALERLCAPLVEAEAVVGLAVGVLDGDATTVRGFGRIARGGEAVPAGDTVYEIGSVTKVFTGLLLADAAERGLVSLDEPAARHLPEGASMPTFEGEPVRLWHLATHTSGLPRMPPDFAPAEPTNPYADYDADKLHRTLALVRLRDEPGGSYEYSNLGAGLLGHLLVRASGLASYEQLLVERVAEPLGLRDTRVALTESMRARLAPPHDADCTPAHSWDLDALAGAGGLRSTVDDMLRFARAQLQPGDSPLGAAIRRSQQRRHDGRGGVAMALGWHIAQDGATLWHNGQTGGYHSFLAVQPAAGRAVCVLSNAAAGCIDALGQRILQHLQGVEVARLEIERPVAVEREALRRCAGRYRMGLAGTLVVELRQEGLFARLGAQPFRRLYPRSGTEFFCRAVPASITFEVGAAGDARAAVLHQQGQSRRGERMAGEQ